MDDAICQKLGLVPIRYANIVGVSGKPAKYPVYLMAVGLGMSAAPRAGARSGATSIVTFQAEIVGMPPPKGNCQGLLGRDFLQRMRLVYDGPTGCFEIIDRSHVLAKSAPQALLAAGAKSKGSGKAQTKAKAKRTQRKKSKRRNRK